MTKQIDKNHDSAFSAVNGVERLFIHFLSLFILVHFFFFYFRFLFVCCLFVFWTNVVTHSHASLINISIRHGLSELVVHCSYHSIVGNKSILVHCCIVLFTLFYIEYKIF